MANPILADSDSSDNPNTDDLRKLDRQIAERLGWRVEQWVFTPDLTHWKPSLGNYQKPAASTVFYRLVRPDGNVAYPYGKSADDPFNGALPRYTRDLNILAPLLRQWHESDTIDLLDDSLDALGMEGVFDLLLKGDYITLCKAWIVWWDVRHQEGGE